MRGQFAFSVDGSVVEALPNALFLIELSNGHRLLGHVARRQKPLAERLKFGAKVTVELSPSDLSQGRVILNEDKI